jgi:hypothetical protein
MSLYHINEGTFDLPDDWSDRSMNIFTPDESENPEWNIVVSRDKLAEDVTLTDYLENQLTEMPKALPRFRLISNEEIAINDVPAREVVSTWIGDGGTVRQKQVVFVIESKSLVFTFTVLERLFSQYSTVLDDFVKTFIVRRKG